MRYKVLFVGLGSIGKRHLKNLVSLCGDDCEIDALRRKIVTAEHISHIYTKYEDVPDGYDVIFITNPTSLHYEAIQSLANKTKNMFIEKPIFDKPMECLFPEGINYVACPLRHNSVIKDLRKYVKTHRIHAFRAICSSYLPEWRERTDYRNSYSAKKNMGGGVELDLIHEIDYLRWIFDDFSNVKRISGKKSHLEISSNDIAVYLFENSNVIGSSHLDYFGRVHKREIEVFSQNETRTFDLLKDEGDMYMEEMKYFLDIVNNKPASYYNTPEFALESIRMAIGF